ncbi:hypothetical protein F2Q69_00036959 [Brassica cretica]|uniref:Uncharacterized protein n=1 Tax=Brassica cretica TaxID=69181 RepID=A0A8S9SUH6_BRACR|nr:hypothetical protein F2Q69_00036959 [Brassica cretica]
MSSEQALRESMVGAGILTFSACCNEEETFDLPMSLGSSLPPKHHEIPSL